jgi:hypothetical protein
MVTYIIPVYYYEEEESHTESIELKGDQSMILWVAIIVILIMIKIFIVFLKRKIERRYRGNSK